MTRLCLGVIGILVAWCVVATATTVDHGWSGDTYVIHVHEIDDAAENNYLLPTFRLVNEGKWEIVWDNVNDAIMFYNGASLTLKNADAQVAFTAYEELNLTLPSRLVMEGDTIVVYVMWVDADRPTATFSVETGGPVSEESEATGRVMSVPFPLHAPVQATPHLLEVSIEYAADGSAEATIRNPGTRVSRSDLKVTATLSYYRDWYGETVTQFLDRTLGWILLVPDAALQLTVQLGVPTEERYVVTFLDFTDRNTGEPLAVSVPPPTESAIAAFREMIYSVWTGVADKEPDVDYIDLGFGFPAAHLYFPITPYFAPPR
ncbi:hypothetical protein ACFLS5_05375 [Candidatus Bipolaricaulota bacterium]